MRRLLNKIIYNRLLAKMWLSINIKLNNYSYKTISRLVVIVNKGIHPKHKILNYHQFFVDNVSEHDTIIDIGCGIGANAYDIAKKAKKVVGIDKSKKNIRFAKKHYQKDNIKYITGDVTNYKFDNRFDKIVLSNILEHINERINFLKKLHNLSNTILLRVPMITRDWLSVYKKEMGYEYRLDNTHFIEYTIEDLSEELEKSGWRIKNNSIQFGEFWGIVQSKF